MSGARAVVTEGSIAKPFGSIGVCLGVPGCVFGHFRDFGHFA